MRGTLPAGLYPGVEGDVGISVSVRTKKPFSETLSVIPRALTLGLGCRRGTAKQALAQTVFEVFQENGLDLRAVREAASIDLKADEPGLLAFVNSLASRFCSTRGNACSCQGRFTPSAFVQGVRGV